MLPNSLPFSEKHLEEISDSLNSLQWETEASCVLLADITGQLIEERGNTAQMNTAVLSALAAAELAATKEIARLVGEKARFKMLLQEGEKQSIYLSDVGEELVLVTVFDNETPIGMVRVFTKQTVDRLSEILEKARVEERDDEGKGKDKDNLTDDFGQLLSDQLDATLGA